MRIILWFIVFIGLRATLGFGQNAEILMNIPVGNAESAASITWDEKFIIGSRNENLLLYDYQSGRLLKKFWSEPNRKRITDVLVISDDYVLAATENKLWEVSIGDGKKISQYKQVSLPLKKLKISANGLYFGALSQSGTSLSIFDISTQDLVLRLNNQDLKGQSISDFDFAKDGKMILTSTENKVIEWKLKNGKQKKNLSIPKVQRLISIPASKYFVTSNGSRDISVHSLRKHNVATIPLTREPIFISSDLSNNVFIAGDPSSFYAFDIDGNLLQKLPHNHGSNLTKMDITVNGWMLLKNAYGAFVFMDMYELKAESSSQYPWRKPHLQDVGFEEMGTSFVMRSGDYEFKIPIKKNDEGSSQKLSSKYDIRIDQSILRIIRKENNNEVRLFDVGSSEITTWKTSRDLSRLFIADAKNKVYYYDVDLRRLVGDIQTLPYPILDFEYLDDFNMIAARHEFGVSFGTKDGLISTVSTDFPISKIRFSENGKVGVISEKHPAPFRITILEYSRITSSHLPLHTLDMEHPYDEVAVTPDGSFVIISELNGPVHIYDIAAKTVVAQLYVMNQNADYIVFTPDGRYDQSRENFIKYAYSVQNSKVLPYSEMTQLKYEQGLLENVFEKMQSVEKEIKPEIDLESIDFRPIFFVDPKPAAVLEKDRVKITLEQNPRFEDVKEVNIFHNEILVSQVGIDRFATDENDRTFYSFDLKLNSGMNVISLRTKLLSEREQQIDMLHLVQGEVQRSTSTMHVLGVSIDEYGLNGKKVNMAGAELSEILEGFQKGHSKAFKNINIVTLPNESATHSSILNSIEKITSSMGKEDVLVLYLVGAGGIDLDEGLYFMGSDEKEKTSVEKIIRLLPNQDFLLIMDLAEYTFRELNKLPEVMFLDKRFHVYINDRKSNPSFSSVLLEGLAGASDNAILDKLITARELRRYLSRRFPGEANLFLSRGADFVLGAVE